MASAVLHAQMMLLCLDEVANDQDLFKQDFKQTIKRSIEALESKLGKIYHAMTEQEQSEYGLLLKEKMHAYSMVDNMDTFEQIRLFNNYANLQKKLV